MHSHHKLDQIFFILWNEKSELSHIAPRGSFVDLLFRMVFFHQSLAAAVKWPPSLQLTDDETFMYCDPLLLKQMLVLMINDSSSYHYIDDQELVNENTKEQTNANQLAILKWQHKYQHL